MFHALMTALWGLVFVKIQDVYVKIGGIKKPIKKTPLFRGVFDILEVDFSGLYSIFYTVFFIQCFYTVIFVHIILDTVFFIAVLKS